MKGTNNLEEGTEDDQPEGEMQIGHLELNALNFLSHDEDSDAASEEAYHYYNRPQMVIDDLKEQRDVRTSIMLMPYTRK